MPLNKLENFIKNAEGRILYVNPNDLDSTDGIENQGNSLTKPFKTIQRALLESARFSYLRGEDNDIVEKTTILVFPRVSKFIIVIVKLIINSTIKMNYITCGSNFYIV